MLARFAHAVSLLTYRRDLLLEDIAASRNLSLYLLVLSPVLILGAAAYGAVLGLWRDDVLAAYVAVKLPLLLGSTAMLTMLFNWTVSRFLGLPLRLAQVAVLTVMALAVASLLLFAVAPIAWLFTISAPPAGSDARTTHNVLYLLHTVAVGGCGLVGTLSLFTLLSRVCPEGSSARTVWVIWVAVFAFVGGEVAWALRPFVGSVYYPVVFLREDALDGNVYEFVLSDILPHLLRNGGR